MYKHKYLINVIEIIFPAHSIEWNKKKSAVNMYAYINKLNRIITIKDVFSE